MTTTAFVISAAMAAAKAAACQAAAEVLATHGRHIDGWTLHDSMVRCDFSPMRQAVLEAAEAAQAAAGSASYQPEANDATTGLYSRSGGMP